MKLLPYGPNAWLLRFADSVDEESFQLGRAIAAELERSPPAGLREFVPAFTAVLLEFDPAHADEAASALAELAERIESAARTALPEPPVKEIPVTYDGVDLERVSRHNQITVSEVCRLHAAPVYRVHMLGFAPGFPYLGGLDPRLHTPRLVSPRPRVAAGAVAIGGEHTGIYSVASPGGWNLIGRTTANLFDPTRGEMNREAMFLLHAGDRVKFIPTNSP